VTVKINKSTQQYIGKKLRDFREEKKLSQESVADSVGISITYYAGIERGEENPTVAIIEALCDVLKVKSSNILPF
jgi:transcriptional regulator with XRE-family HTH domain